MAKTLADSLQSASVDWSTLHRNYSPLLNLVRELIGVIPNCDPTLEIWKPGFRTYNLLVPNMFNLPNTVFGSKSFKAAMGLAMYASSKAACAYCTAHTCSFALRRGTRTEAISGVRTEKEQVVVRLAEGMANIPSSLSIADVESVRQHFSPSQTEWLVYAISMMGFLNKFMSVMGIALEQEAINDTAEILTATGWQPGIHARKGYSVTKAGIPKKDNIFTYLRVVRQAPGAVLWEKKWTRGVPSEYGAAAIYLQQHTGYNFPILSPVKEGRVIRALSAVLRDNLDPAQSATGLKIKMYTGYIFSTMMQNQRLASEIRNLAVQWAPELNNETYKLLNESSYMEIPSNYDECKTAMASLQAKLSLNGREAAAILLAIATTSNPNRNNDTITEAVVHYIEPAGIVETVVWLSVLQLLSRLSSYYTIIQQSKPHYA